MISDVTPTHGPHQFCAFFLSTCYFSRKLGTHWVLCYNDSECIAFDFLVEGALLLRIYFSCVVLRKPHSATLKSQHLTYVTSLFQKWFLSNHRTCLTKRLKNWGFTGTIVPPCVNPTRQCFVRCSFPQLPDCTEDAPAGLLRTFPAFEETLVPVERCSRVLHVTRGSEVQGPRNNDQCPAGREG